MNQKHEKKLRREMRKASNKWAASKGAKAAWQIARQRDIIFLICLGELVIIILLFWRLFL
ncbi:MAG: hypothetical protein PHS93_08095 [Candidatus Omnitrophica bacterium]|nr:hypothetical protein [Candidatus Omnitrophota bacterium]MDD5353103.1 hypothetical protein [Candidatus Omnitrophota bacterium]MDD5551480.1 hypothetical protein [Candidatus Omnitrophota bacterium]